MAGRRTSGRRRCTRAHDRRPPRAAPSGQTSAAALPRRVRVIALRVSRSSSSAAARSPADTASASAPGVRVAARRAARRSSSLRNDAVTPSVRAMTSSRPDGVDRQRAAVELEQRAAGVRVGQFQRDRLVDPAGPRGQRGLEQVGPVGGQHEDDVGVLGEAVHLVEQLEQQRVLAGVHAAVLGDQVDVLDDDHRRLQGAGHRARLGDQVQRVRRSAGGPSCPPGCWCR